MTKKKLIDLPEGQHLFEDFEQNKGYYSVSGENCDIIEETQRKYSNQQQIPDDLIVQVLKVGIIREDDKSVEYSIISNKYIDVPIKKITGTWVKGGGW